MLKFIVLCQKKQLLILNFDFTGATAKVKISWALVVGRFGWSDQKAFKIQDQRVHFPWKPDNEEKYGKMVNFGLTLKWFPSLRADFFQTFWQEKNFNKSLKILMQRRLTQMRPRAAFSKNRLMKGQFFRKFQWPCWFFPKRTISRESWRAAEKSFKGRGLADAVLMDPNSRKACSRKFKLTVFE
jgi:hypothetical protein